MDKEPIKKVSQDVEPLDMVEVPQGDVTPDDIGAGEGGEDFIGGGGGGDLGGDGMDFADNLEPGAGPQPPQETIDWDQVNIIPTGDLDNIIDNQEDFEIDFSKLV